MDIKTLVTHLSTVRTKIAECQKSLNSAKELEEKLISLILSSLNAQGVKSMNFDGLGSVQVSTRDHAELRNFDKLAIFVLDYAKNSEAHGFSGADALTLLQKRVSVTSVKEFIEQGFSPADMGVELVEKPTLKFVPSKVS